MEIEYVEEFLKETFGYLYGRVKETTSIYEEEFSFDIINILSYATDQGFKKIEEVLDELELASQKRYNKNSNEILTTKEILKDIGKRILGLEPKNSFYN